MSVLLLLMITNCTQMTEEGIDVGSRKLVIALNNLNMPWSSKYDMLLNTTGITLKHTILKCLKLMQITQFKLKFDMSLEHLSTYLLLVISFCESSIGPICLSTAELFSTYYFPFSKSYKSSKASNANITYDYFSLYLETQWNKRKLQGTYGALGTRQGNWTTFNNC